jgi:hypothetical protein
MAFTLTIAESAEFTLAGGTKKNKNVIFKTGRLKTGHKYKTMAKKLFSFRLDPDLVEKDLVKYAKHDNNGRKLTDNTARVTHVLSNFILEKKKQKNETNNGN